MSIAHNRDPSPFHESIETQRDAVVQPSANTRASFQSALASAASSRARTTSSAPCWDWSAPHAKPRRRALMLSTPKLYATLKELIERIASTALDVRNSSGEAR
jgi:hypothetical protein